MSRYPEPDQVVSPRIFGVAPEAKPKVLHPLAVYFAESLCPGSMLGTKDPNDVEALANNVLKGALALHRGLEEQGFLAADAVRSK